MSDKMETFLEKVKGDKGLQEKLRGAIDINKIAAIAKGAGVDISSGEIAKFMDSRVASLADGDLDEMAGLAQVVGGLGATKCWGTCSNNSRALC